MMMMLMIDEFREMLEESVMTCFEGGLLFRYLGGQRRKQKNFYRNSLFTDRDLNCEPLQYLLNTLLELALTMEAVRVVKMAVFWVVAP
jgi:hypothetical protein